MPVPAAEGGFADDAFQRVWNRTDSPQVIGGQRSYYWGPSPGATKMEQYAEGVDGKRLVQYFDKSRMEINNPGGDRNNPFYVTNGLLTVELVSGKMQVGNSKYENRTPANIPLASDNNDGNAPTYASFTKLANSPLGGHPAQPATGLVNQKVDKEGRVSTDAAGYNKYGVKYGFYNAETKHNIADKMWDFLNAIGPTLDPKGQTVNARLSDPWFYATGYAISEPYWANVKIADKQSDVLIQLFERRVVTYVPSEPQPQFRVQMGNIGAHYYDWRYKPSPTAGHIVFSSWRSGNQDIWRIKGDGKEPTQLTKDPNIDEYPAYSPDGSMVAFSSNRSDNDFEIYVRQESDGSVQRVTESPGRDSVPSWSPDGTRLVFVSERGNQKGDLYVMNADGTGSPTPLMQAAGEDFGPSWGSKDHIVFSSNRTGTFQIYSVSAQQRVLYGPLTNLGQNYQAKWNRDATRIVFVSDRDGHPEIYTMDPTDPSGNDQVRLTNTDAAVKNVEPSYSPDGSRIVFASNRAAPNTPGSYDLYTMSITGQDVKPITSEPHDDFQPSWSNP
jgi:Tol biopolymer transport system component